MAEQAETIQETEAVGNQGVLIAYYDDPRFQPGFLKHKRHRVRKTGKLEISRHPETGEPIPFDDKGLPPSHYAVYSAIRGRASKSQPNPFPSHETIAADARCTVRTVTRAINDLEARGVLEVRKRGRGFQYFFLGLSNFQAVYEGRNRRRGGVVVSIEDARKARAGVPSKPPKLAERKPTTSDKIDTNKPTTSDKSAARNHEVLSSRGNYPPPIQTNSNSVGETGTERWGRVFESLKKKGVQEPRARKIAANPKISPAVVGRAWWHTNQAGAKNPPALLAHKLENQLEAIADELRREANRAERRLVSAEDFR